MTKADSGDTVHEKKAGERINEIFAQALERKSPAEREKFLTEAFRGDPELRRQVESLLQAHEQAGDSLGPTMPLPASDFTIEGAGMRIGRYKLLQKIGEGGFGVVYMAEQIEPVQRRVAVKIIKAGMDTRDVIARFEAERQALALMDHPNIARVLDAGATVAGRPYFVMELVNGISITDYCDRQQLSTTERLRLFMKVCSGVQHAHQKGIIHRDLKPNNVLVTLHDSEPAPKVIDFGVAKALGQKLTEKTLFTAFQQIIGTPAYMSPEQAESSVDIDTRADIYSLGALLYELLTGETPLNTDTWREAALDEIRQTIREAEPPRPSTRLRTLGDKLAEVAKRRQTEPMALKRMLRGDLDWIVMKALEKDRRRRYETADAFASDVARYLNDEPVVARPPSRIYRLQKLLRRNKAVFATGAVVTTALVFGLGFSLWSLASERVALQRAVVAEKQAQAEAGKSRQVAQFLEDTLQGVGPSVALGRDTTMLREILDRTAERLSKDLQGQPEVEAELRYTLGWVYFDLGDDSAAETFHRDALALRIKLHGTQHPDVSASLHGLGLALWKQGKLAEAEKVQREALAIRRKTFGNDNLDTARSLNDLAAVVIGQGKPAEAEAMCREALLTRRKLLREPHPDVANSLNILSFALDDQGKLAEAESFHRETLAMRRTLYGDKHPSVAFSLGALGAVLAREGKLSEAESLLYESVAMWRGLQRRDHLDSLMSLYALAKLLVREGRLAEAAKLRHQEAGTEPAAILNSIAWPLATCVHAQMRDGAAAVSFAEQAVAATKRKNATYLDTLAAAYAETGQFAKAVSAVSEAIALLSDGKLKEDCESRLKLYEANSPYRERGL